MRWGPGWAVLVLAALLAPQVLAQAPPGRPLLPPIQAPQWSVGDTWEYLDYHFENDDACNQTMGRAAPFTVRVAAAEAWNGTPALRVESQTATRTSEPATPEFPLPVVRVVVRNFTRWVAEPGLEVLREVAVQDTNTLAEGGEFKQLERRTLTTELHEPVDRYQFPIVGAVGTGEGDAWLAVQNATVVQNTTYVFEVAGQPPNTSYAREQRNAVRVVSSLVWLRQDVLTTAAGTFDVVVLQESKGNVTLFEVFAPAVGSFVQQGILSPRGCEVERMVLQSFTYQAAPKPPPGGDGLGAAAPMLAAAGAGVLLGAALLAARRRRQRPGAGAPPSEEPAGPPEPPAPPGS